MSELSTTPDASVMEETQHNSTVSAPTDKPIPSAIPMEPTPARTEAAETIPDTDATRDVLGQNASEDGHVSYKDTKDYSRGLPPSIAVNASGTRDVIGTVGTIVYQSSGNASTVQVNSEIDENGRDRLKKVFVAPSKYDELSNRIRQRNILLIWGKKGTGKYSVARRLLHTFEPEKKKIITISPSTTVEQLLRFNFTEGYGYIVDSWQHQSQLKSFDIDTIHQKLVDSNSHLIMSFHSQTPLSQERGGLYSHDIGNVPKSVELLQQHVSAELLHDSSQVKAKAKSIIEHAAIQSELSQQLTLGSVLYLATAIANIARESGDVDDVLAEYWGYIYQEAIDWFSDEPRTADERILMLTIAVFDGARQEEIHKAEDRLKELTRGLVGDTVSPDIFAHWENRVAQVRATQFSTANQYYDDIRIRLENTHYRGAILSYVWRHITGFRKPLLRWLAEYGAANSDMRGRAASVVGFLASLTPDQVIDEIIHPWALSDSGSERVAASIALSMLSEDTRFTDLVMARLKHYSKSRSLTLQLTAATTYGLSIGATNPATAIQSLNYLILQQGSRQEVAMSLVTQIVLSVRSIVQAGINDSTHNDIIHLRVVLEMLETWTQPNEQPSSLSAWVGILAFLRLTTIRTRTGSNSLLQPLLLVVCERDKESREIVITLWRRAIEHHLTSEYAFDTMLARWLRATVSDELVKTSLQKLIKRISYPPNTDAVKYWLRQQACHPGRHAQVAGMYLRALSS